MTEQTTQCECIIVGGGMVGATLACILGEAGVSVLLVDKNPVPLDWSDQGFDLRVSAITRASQRIFESIGAWQPMVDRRVNAYQQMHVWDAGGNGVVHFDCADVAEPALGHIVENRVVQAGLHMRLKSLPSVRYLAPANALDIQVGDDDVCLRLHDGSRYRAHLLVGADGARSWVRSAIGIAAEVTDYGQRAIVATVKTERHHQDTAWQRFLATGPLAFLPMSDGYCSIVWSVSSADAERILNLTEEAFREALTEASEHALGHVLEASPRQAIPLMARHAEHYVLPRIALVGDAAHTIHPLAGQGVNLGLSDVACLGEILLQALHKGQDLGALKVLRPYERWRRGDNALMQTAMTGFKVLFGNEQPVLSQLRNLGLNLVNRTEPAKQFFIRYAMGLAGDLPALARGVRPNP